MALITEEIQNQCVGATLLKAIHATSARSSLPDTLTGPAFLLRRRSANETLILAQAPKGIRFAEDKMQPMVAQLGAPKAVRFAEDEMEPMVAQLEGKTTIMLQNIPVHLSRDMLLETLRAKGIAKFVDFVYVPFDLKDGCCYGWAYVNFSTPDAATDCSAVLNGSCDWGGFLSEKPCEVSWCTRHQGLEALTEYYRNSQVMHEKMMDKFKPAVFKDGIRVDFPPPTKKITANRQNICRQRNFN